jgi:GINS complex subunit 2
MDFRASDDLESSDKLRSLLKDLREARQAKSREGLDKLNYSELSVSVFTEIRRYDGI